MLSRFSVKRPYYVFVAVVIILILGAVSVTAMKTDLLPEFNLPYMAVITTDPGASPEQVEEEVSDVLEAPLSSVSGVSNMYTTSSENVSLIFLEFADGTDMDSAQVKVSAAVNQVAGQLPDAAGTPTYMEMSMDMMASVYLGVSADDMEIAELTQKVSDDVVPALQRADGVANVTSSGDVTDSVQIKLNQDKIDNVNAGVLGEVNSKLASAKSKIDAGERQLDSAEAKVKKQQKKLKKAEKKALKGFNKAKEATNTLLSAKAAAQAQVAIIDANIQTLQAQYAVYEQAGMGQTDQAQQLKTQIEQLQKSKTTAEKSIKEKIDAPLAKTQEATSQESSTTLQFANAESQLTQALSSIESSRTQLKQSKQEYETSAEEARGNASIDKLVDASTLAQLISAQNLEMPAGYVDGEGNDQWVVKVGQEYSSIDELKKMVLTKIDGVGEVTLEDVADVVTANDAGESYAKMNGEDAILLAVTKQSTANTGEVSDAVAKAVDKLEESDSSLHITSVMDQGEYIDLYISTILSSLLLGALLAVIVLAVFLKRIAPTLIVAFSIPFSVLFALVIMYFTGLTLNIMTLGALSLAIGMLVDNSIVVMENIYRLKARGLSATRAAAQGALQVTGAVVASTITSVCVFLPFVFSDGTVRQLMVPFALTMSFALLASLLVALSIVPALGSKIFKNTQPAEVKWFEKLKGVYGKWLERALDHKAPVLIVSVALLGVAIGIVVQMGIVMLPTMSSSQISLNMTVADGIDREDAYELADVVGQRVAAVDGIAEVGVADSSTTSGTVSGLASASGSVYTGRFAVYATLDSSKVNTEAAEIDLENRVLESCADLEDVTLVSENSMDSMSSLTGGDVSVEVQSDTMDGAIALSEKVMDAMRGIEGYEEIDNGQEDADKALRVDIDKDKVAGMGTTVAQVYQTVSAKLKDSTSAITMSTGGKQVSVEVDTSKVDDYGMDNLLDIEFEDSNGDKHKLSEVAKLSEEPGVAQVYSVNQVYTVNVTAEVADGYNVALLGRQLSPELEQIDVPDGSSVELEGANADIDEMMMQMFKLIALGFILLYLVMVAQFQSLLSPFIIIFTVPLAFTGGLFALVIAGEQLSMMAMLGFVILMGTVVNNGIVFVDFVNQLRLGGMAKRAALIATGVTRMRPILMTALTTIISMCALIFSQQIGSGMERGMALVVAGGLLYATFMTLFVVPVIYDIFSRKPMVPVDVGDDTDVDAGDAEEFIAQMGDDARETYDYESRRARRKRLRAECKSLGAHSELAKLDEEAPSAVDDALADDAGEQSGSEG